MTCLVYFAAFAKHSEIWILKRALLINIIIYNFIPTCSAHMARVESRMRRPVIHTYSRDIHSSVCQCKR